ncbi:MAG: hypothetical protein AAF616_10685 [Bacteroidota bacterium]
MKSNTEYSITVVAKVADLLLTSDTLTVLPNRSYNKKTQVQN